jgi:hypothetical protein
VMMGSLELESLAPRPARGQSARVRPMPAAPAASALQPSAAVPEPSSAAWSQALEFPPAVAAAPFDLLQARSQPLELASAVSTRASLGPNNRFALPAYPPPSAAAGKMRSPNARMRPAPRRASSVSVKAPAHAHKHGALVAHPVTRFLGVLCALSAVFLLILAVL